MVGILGVTDMEGALLFRAPREGIGDSFTAIVGIAGVLPLEPLLGAGVSLTEIVGMDAGMDLEGVLLLRNPGLDDTGDSFTEMDGIGD